MKNYKVRYKRNTYQLYNDSIVNIFNINDNKDEECTHLEEITGDETQTHLDLDFFEIKDVLNLIITKVFFTKDLEFRVETKNLEFKKSDLINKDLDLKIEYKEEIEEIETIIKDNLIYFNTIYTTSNTNHNVSNLSKLLIRIMEVKEPYLYETFKEHKNKISEKIASINKINTKYILLNIFNATFYIPDGFEKLLKSNPDIIYENFDKTTIGLKNEGKINNVIQIPKFVLEFIEKHNYQTLTPEFQKLKIEGNEYRILIDFLTNANSLVIARNRSNVYSKFLKNINSIMEYDDYKLQDLLSFLLKEAFINPVSDRKGYHELVDLFPLNESKLMIDYLEMAKMNNLKHKKYPRILLDHNIMMKNLQSLETIDENEFQKMVLSYSKMTSNFKEKGYIMQVPVGLHSMIEEGNTLHHCVASYSHRILDGSSKIFFLRKVEDVNTPYITVEVDKDNNLSHIRGAYNEEPNEETIAMVEKWLKKNR